jgi:plastocyanin
MNTKVDLNRTFHFLAKGRTAAVLCSLFFPWCGQAATVGVNIINFAFQPPSVTITQNDSVVWTQKDTTSHTSTSDTAGVWDSGLLTINQTFSNTFSATGSFPYHCTVHPFMKASVTVQAAATN